MVSVCELKDKVEWKSLLIANECLKGRTRREFWVWLSECWCVLPERTVLFLTSVWKLNLRQVDSNSSIPSLANRLSQLVRVSIPFTWSSAPLSGRACLSLSHTSFPPSLLQSSSDNSFDLLYDENNFQKIENISRHPSALVMKKLWCLCMFQSNMKSIGMSQEKSLYFKPKLRIDAYFLRKQEKTCSLCLFNIRIYR